MNEILVLFVQMNLWVWEVMIPKAVMGRGAGLLLLKFFISLEVQSELP